MRGQHRRRIARHVALATGTIIATIAALSGSASAQPTAQTARTINLTERAELHLVRRDGSTIWERGTATGTLPGTVNARFEMTLTKVTGTVTIRARGGGSLTIVIVGYAQSAGINARFTGTIAVRRGTGRFADAVGSGTFDGTVNRRTWDATVTAKARLTY
jgi:hypothetical protein